MLAIETLADLTDYHLYGVCNTCSRMERLKMLVLYDGLRPEHPIAAVSRHLKCSECGGRDTVARGCRKPYSVRAAAG